MTESGKRNMRLILGMGGFAAVFVAILLVGGGRQEAAPARPFQIPLSSDIRSTSPGVNRDANTDTVMMHVFEGLVAYRENGTPGLLLADAIDVSPDGRRYEFRLRRGVRFHNGEPMTARDVVWSWRRYLDPRTGWSCLSAFDGSRGARIQSVEALDGERVVFTLSQPQPLLLTQMADIQCGGSAIIHPASLNPDGSWRWPVATGPYRLTSWKRGRHIDLEAFGQYSRRSGPRDGNTGGKVAYEPRLRWLIIRDAASRLAALSKGQVDVMPELPAPEMLQVRQLKDVTIAVRPMLGAYGLLVQDHDPLLADPRVRQAIALSIDRRAVAGLVTADVAGANPSMVPTASPYHTAAHDLGAVHHPERARRLLAQAGYRGQPIILTTNRRYPAMFNQALVVQAMARGSGLNIKLEVVEWATQMDRWRSGRFQLMSFGFSARADPSLNYESILGDRAANKSKVWDNPAALALAADALRTSDPKARQAIFDQLQVLMIQDAPFIALFSPPDVNAVHRSVTGFSSWPFGRARFWGVRRSTGAAK
ncbi:ABC transporter substrate-binding protein [Phenylobacterium sp.]|uniref:ABC transporter substrate-binding protein n=1 Tax=Phenylobacterium sp. TaxID=1871053 RepID=UPI002FC83B5B